MKTYQNTIGILERNFLSELEIEDIKDKVLGLKEIWYSPEGSVNNSGIKINFLPPGLYTRGMIDENVYDDLINSVRDTMMENFSVYYEKLSKKVEDIFDRDVIFDKTLCVPGFHIFSSQRNSIYNVEMFHEDWFPGYSTFTDGDIYSMVIPICLPKKGSGIYFEDKTEHNKIKHLKYEEGSLGFWDGSIKHRIDNFQLTGNNDYRMTLQCHLSVHPNEVYIFW